MLETPPAHVRFRSIQYQTKRKHRLMFVSQLKVNVTIFIHLLILYRKHIMNFCIKKVTLRLAFVTLESWDSTRKQPRQKFWSRTELSCLPRPESERGFTKYSEANYFVLMKSVEISDCGSSKQTEKNWCFKTTK